MTTALPPRVTWNEKLYLDFMQKHDNPPMYPRVSQQARMVPLNRRALFAGGYNPSIIRHNTKLLMAYRYHVDGTPATSLAIAELDEDFNVTNNSQIMVAGGSIEDPRLFEHQGELYCCYVDSTWPARPICVTKYGKLSKASIGWSIRDMQQVRYGNNDGSALEKNWIPFSIGDKLYFIYQSHPEQIVIEVNGPTVVNEYKTTGPRWGYGEIRGGTTPLPSVDGETIWRAFHSRSLNEPIPHPWRYYIGGMTMKCEPPFEVDTVDSKPFLKGSEADDLTDTERASIGHYKTKVVFPAGAIVHNGETIVSVGCNDAECLLVKL